MNIPNILSAFRIALIPLVAYLFSLQRFDLVAVFFLLACFTDIIDGIIARRFHMITNVGKLLDPVADKGMQITVLLSLAWCERMPWLAVLVIFCKEILLFFGGLLLYNRKIVRGANWYGKLATVLISTCVAAILLLYDILSPFLRVVCQWAPVAVSIFAFVMYFCFYIKTVKEGKNA